MLVPVHEDTPGALGVVILFGCIKLQVSGNLLGGSFELSGAEPSGRAVCKNVPERED